MSNHRSRHFWPLESGELREFRRKSTIMAATRLGYDGNEVLENVFPVSRIVLHNYFEEISYRKFVFSEERYFSFNFLTL